MTEQEFQDARNNWSTLSPEQKFDFMVEISRDYASQYGLPPDTFSYFPYGPQDAEYVANGNDYGYYERRTESIHFNTDDKSQENFRECVNTAIHETLHGIDHITGYSAELDQIEGIPDDHDHPYINKESAEATQDYWDYHDDIFTVISFWDEEGSGEGGNAGDGGGLDGGLDGDGAGRNQGQVEREGFGEAATESYEQGDGGGEAEPQDGGYGVAGDPGIEIDMSSDPEIHDTDEKVAYVDFSDEEAGTIK